MRTRAGVVLLLGVALLWIAALALWRRSDDLGRLEVLVLLAAPLTTLALLAVLVRRPSGRR